MEVQSTTSWGLDYIDGTRDSKYSYESTGAGIRIYVVDTGIDASHPELSNRVLDGFDAFNENLDQTDCNGHGTHIAGVMASSNYGVAKQALLVPVRVLNCSSGGNTNTLLSGLSWISSSHPVGTKGIVNMSLAGVKNDKVDKAVKNLIGMGLAVVAAAGNSNTDSCKLSPAGAEGVITVGSVSNDQKRSSFSNWGNCVDIFAPGERIESITANNYGKVTSRTGTSQSAPFISGILASYWAKYPAMSSAELESKLYSTARANVVIDGKSLRNSIATIEPLSTEVASPIELPTTIDEPEPSKVMVYQNGAGSYFGTLKWQPLETSSGYRVYKTGSVRPQWRLFRLINRATQITISDKPGVVALYRVVAVTSAGEVDLGTIRYSPTK
jgi:subtilisin family serine protease